MAATTEPLCASCGARLHPGFRFCGACGKPIGASPPPARPERIRVTLLRGDGLPGTVFSVDGDEALCGRTEGEIRLPDDPTVSPRHARFTAAAGAVRVEDLGSLNGTFVRLRGPRRLAPGEEIRVGLQLLRLEPLPRPAHPEERGVRTWGSRDPGCRWRLSQVLEGGGLGEVFPLREGESVVGRETGEVTFPSDRYVSARHCRLEITAGQVTLADAGSSNGTYVRIEGSAELVRGDQLLVGAQLLRVE